MAVPLQAATLFDGRGVAFELHVYSAAKAWVMSFLGGEGFALVHFHELMSLSSFVPPLRMSSCADSEGSTKNWLGSDLVVPAGTPYPGAKAHVTGFTLWRLECALQI